MGSTELNELKASILDLIFEVQKYGRPIPMYDTSEFLGKPLLDEEYRLKNYKGDLVYIIKNVEYDPTNFNYTTTKTYNFKVKIVDMPSLIK